MQASQAIDVMTPAELYNALQFTDHLILDVRSVEAYDTLHVKTALNVNVASLKSLTATGITLRCYRTSPPRGSCR